MNNERGGVGVCVLGGRLCAVEGYDDSERDLSSVGRCDVEEDQWGAVASMSSERYIMGVGVLGGRLYTQWGVMVVAADICHR